MYEKVNIGALGSGDISRSTVLRTVASVVSFLTIITRGTMPAIYWASSNSKYLLCHIGNVHPFNVYLKFLIKAFVVRNHVGCPDGNTSGPSHLIMHIDGIADFPYHDKW